MKATHVCILELLNQASIVSMGDKFNLQRISIFSLQYSPIKTCKVSSYVDLYRQDRCSDGIPVSE